IVATCFTGSSAWAKGDANTQRNEIREMRDQVLNDLYKLKPELKSRIKKAEGYAVFTNVGVNLLIASFAGGKGIVVENGFFKDPETFMKMGSAGIGLGLGIKDFRAVFVFTAKDTMKAFVDKGWDFSGQVDATGQVGPKRRRGWRRGHRCAWHGSLSDHQERHRSAGHHPRHQVLEGQGAELSLGYAFGCVRNSGRSSPNALIEIKT
uniref:lipid-binding SYLF domain-containing protein n=1 Tax=Cephaloticoccus sp. TaxID=1985742 RepID=UPI00404A0517